MKFKKTKTKPLNLFNFKSKPLFQFKTKTNSTNSLKFVNLNKYNKRTSSELKLINKKPYHDSDKDKVMNWFDCRPLNKKKQDFGPFKYRGKKEVSEFTAAERFGGANIQRLKRLGAGRDRIVFQLDKDKVVKIAKNVGGLRQNESEGDWYINEAGYRPKYYESGKDYVVMEKVGKLSPANRKKFTEINKNVSGRANPGEVVEALNKKFDPEYTGEDSGKFSDLGNYNLSAGDIIKPSSWGEKEGQVILVDAGGLNEDSINTWKNPHDIKSLKKFKEQLSNVDKEQISGRAQVVEQEIKEWEEVQQGRKQFRKKGVAEPKYGTGEYEKEQYRKGYYYKPSEAPETIQTLDEDDINTEDSVSDEPDYEREDFYKDEK
jgi:hypothetical protein